MTENLTSLPLSVDQFNQQIRPQDDLFRHVNGPWLAATEIKPDRATAGAFVTLVDEAEAKVRQIIEAAAAAPADDEQRKIADLYTSFMDEDRIEQLGAAPLADDLETINGIDSVAALVRALGAFDRQGVGGVFGMYIGPDRGQPDRYVTHLFQGGIGLPDESYYSDDQFAEIRSAYVSHVTTMFTLAGLDYSAARAARVMDLETRLAANHWDRVANRDTHKTYNLLALADLQALAPAFDWSVWSEAGEVPAPVLAEVIVAQPSFVEGLVDLLTDDHLDLWLDWLRFRVISAASPYLSTDFVQANFEFYGRTLQGTDEMRPRWKRAVGFTEGAMGEAIGKIYVSTEFPQASRERMDELIENLTAAYRASITELPWMSDETKAKALEKLEQFTPKIGHPDRFRDYAALETDPADLLGNVRRSVAVDTARELAKIGSPIDRNEWFMTPQTVNAYYNPTMNEIVFPAAILQPPFFHADADDAVNYGAIGAVIGHEIGHGFDDQGSQYDGTGALSNWWTDDDRVAFEQLTASLIGQYSELSPEGADGQKVNGELTIGENIGDLGGLGIAFKAFRMSNPSDEPIDGLTPNQRFFLSWAQAWQIKARPAEAKRRLTVDPHSPGEFRCNQVVRNIDAFYDAFEVSESDDLWLEPAERVAIW